MGDWPQLSVTRLAEDDTAFSSYGVNLAVPGAANTKGAYTQLVASAPFSVCGLVLSMQVDTNTGYLVDIAVGGAGSEVVIVPNIPFGIFGTGGGDTHGILQHFIPVSIPKGTRIAARFQNAAGGTPTRKFKLAMLADGLAGFQAPSRWVDWGTNLSLSLGTTITGGAVNTKGAWSQLVASMDFDTRWILLNMMQGTVVDETVDLGIGSAGNEVVVIPDLHTTNEHWSPSLLIPLALRKGERLAARLADTAGASTVSMTVLGGH